MSPYFRMMTELSEKIPEAWVVDDGWRMIGLPDSRMWLKMDVGHGNYKMPRTDANNWAEARIDIKIVEEPAQRNIATLVGLENAEDAAEKVLQFIEQYRSRERLMKK